MGANGTAISAGHNIDGRHSAFRLHHPERFQLEKKDNLQAMNENEVARRTAPWFAVVSGILGICSFVSLIAYITTPALQMQDSGVAPPLGQLVLTTQFLCSAVQTLMMIPVAIWLYRVAGRRPSGLNGTSLPWTIVGVVAFGSVGLLRLVATMDAAVSDILFMLPLGFVGLWLIAVNWRYLPVLPGWMRIVGGLAGFGLVGVGLNFLFNGGLAVFSKGPFAYGNDVNFHIGLGLFGFPGLTLFATWSIVLGLRLRRLQNSRNA